MGRISRREDDEQLLDMLALRCAGKTSGQIARIHNMPANAVRTKIQRVRDADAAESGEDISDSYWKGRQ